MLFVVFLSDIEMTLCEMSAFVLLALAVIGKLLLGNDSSDTRSHFEFYPERNIKVDIQMSVIRCLEHVRN